MQEKRKNVRRGVSAIGYVIIFALVLTVALGSATLIGERHVVIAVESRKYPLITCPTCQEKVPLGYFCIECGKSMKKSSTQPVEKQKWFHFKKPDHWQIGFYFYIKLIYLLEDF